MSTMTDDFTAWFAAPEQAELRLSCSRGWAELIWQASRAAVVVELPAVEAWLNDGRLDREPDKDAGERMGLVPRIDVRRAIKAAGIGVK